MDDIVFDIDGGMPDRDMTPTIRRAVTYLDGLPDGRLVKVATLAAAIGTTNEHLLNKGTHPAFATRRVRIGQPYYYGNERTVAAWKAQQPEASHG